MPGMEPYIQKEFPEVQNYTRFRNRNKQLIVKDDQNFIVPNVAFVDSTFLDIFDYEMIQGDRATALDAPNSILVTEDLAVKFFKSINKVMNNTLTLEEKESKITGILKNVPENSHFMIIPNSIILALMKSSR